MWQGVKQEKIWTNGGWISTGARPWRVLYAILKNLVIILRAHAMFHFESGMIRFAFQRIALDDIGMDGREARTDTRSPLGSYSREAEERPGQLRLGWWQNKCKGSRLREV